MFKEIDVCFFPYWGHISTDELVLKLFVHHEINLLQLKHPCLNSWGPIAWFNILVSHIT